MHFNCILFLFVIVLLHGSFKQNHELTMKLLPVLLSEHIRTTLAVFIAVGFLFAMLIVVWRNGDTFFLSLMWLDANANKSVSAQDHSKPQRQNHYCHEQSSADMFESVFLSNVIYMLYNDMRFTVINTLQSLMKMTSNGAFFCSFNGGWSSQLVYRVCSSKIKIQASFIQPCVYARSFTFRTQMKMIVLLNLRDFCCQSHSDASKLHIKDQKCIKFKLIQFLHLIVLDYIYFTLMHSRI